MRCEKERGFVASRGRKKRRSRISVATISVLLGIATATLAASATPAYAKAGSARLTIVVEVARGDATPHTEKATLRCSSTRHTGTGFLRKKATAACRLVERGALVKVARDQATRRVCSMIFGGPQSARIRGTVGTKKIDLSVTRSDGCGVADWDRLRALLGDPER